MDVAEGVLAYIGIKTAMGDISGLVNIRGASAELRLAAPPDAAAYLEKNRGFLEGLMAKSGIESFEMQFAEPAALKRQLSAAAILPI